MEEAQFKLAYYKFDRVTLNLGSVTNNTGFSIRFMPSGVFISSENTYNLKFLFEAKDSETEEILVSVNCMATFIFSGNLDKIPNFFYTNAIAILFPYVRAFVSTVTLQANVKPILLPTLNLTSLQTELKNNTEMR